MPSEWAKQKATRIVDGVAFDEGCIEECIGDIAAALDAARAQGRREGLEEAAGIVENSPLRGRLPDGDLFWRGKQNFADDIRARIAQEPQAQEPTE